MGAIEKDMDVKINDYERVDDLHRNGYLIIQDPKRFCFGIDAVILSDFAEVKKGEKVMDLCTGYGNNTDTFGGKDGRLAFYGS